MTALLEHAFQSARALDPAMQDDLARILLQFVGEDQSAVPLTLEERAALEISRAAAERGDFADEAEVAALWAKHGL